MNPFLALFVAPALLFLHAMRWLTGGRVAMNAGLGVIFSILVYAAIIFAILRYV